MVRIPRSEQSVGYGAQMQPFSSGDGYEAKGKAQQKLGQAIQSFGGQLASLGDSFNADAEKEDAYRTQLTALEYDDRVDRDLTEYKMTADPEKWDQYSAGAAERVGRITQEYMPKLSPKGQQQFSLHAARRHNQVMSSAREHQYSLQRQNLHARSEAGVDAIADRLSARYPKESWNPDLAEGIYVPPDVSEIAANVAAAEQAQHAIISKYPGTPQQRAALAKKATDSISKFVINNVPGRYQYSVFEAIDGQLRATTPPDEPVVPGTTPEGTMHRWGGGSGQGQMPTYNPARAGKPSAYLRSKLAPGYESRTSDIDNLHPVMQDRLAAFTAAAEDAGHDIRVVSGHRDAQRQAVLWRNAVAKYGSAEEARKHVAPPGGSSHQSGEAVDLQYGDRGAGLGGKRTAAVEWAHANAARYGLGFPLGHEDWHIEPQEARAGGKRYGGQYDASKTYWKPHAGPALAAGADGRIDPVAFHARAEAKIADSPIVGQVPSWGKQFGIATGSAQEWARFFTMLQQQESGHRVAETNPDGSLKRFATTRPTEQSYGPGQFKPGEYGLKTWADVNNPDKVIDAYIEVAKRGKIPAYFGSVQRDEISQHAKWFDDTVAAKRQTQTAALPVSQRGMVRTASLPQTVNDAGPQPAGNDNARAPNTIPGGDQAPVRVADAGGGIPQSAVPGSQPRMLPAGERRPASYYNEWWREHKEAFRQTQIGAVENAVKQVEASAKETFIHPAAEQIRKEVMNIGDPEMLARIDRAVAGARVGQSMRTMRPDAVNAGVQELRSQMGPTATPEQIANLKMMEAMSSTMNTELAKDQLGWASKAGVIPAPKLIAPETMTVDGLAERAILARQSAENYRLPPQFFQPEEETRLKAVVAQGGKPLLTMLGMMSKGFGPDMPLAVAQIAKDHPEVVQAGWLMANNLNPETAQAIVDGVARRNDPNYKAVTAQGQRTNQEANLQEVLGDTFDLYPQQTKDAITRAAELVYETRNRKPQEYNEKLFKTAVAEVLGETDRGGVKYGGVYSQSRGIGSSLKPWSSSGSGGTRNIILPPHIRNDDTAVTALKQAIATLTPSELAEAGITPPTYRDGRPMPMFKAMAGKFVQADQDGNIGRFTVAHGDPADEAQAGWVLTSPRPFEPVSQADADKRARAKEGADAMGVLPPEGSTVDLMQPPWGSEKSAPLAPTHRWMLDLRPDSALSDILRRKLGRQVFR